MGIIESNKNDRLINSQYKDANKVNAMYIEDTVNLNGNGNEQELENQKENQKRVISTPTQQKLEIVDFSDFQQKASCLNFGNNNDATIKDEFTISKEQQKFQNQGSVIETNNTDPKAQTYHLEKRYFPKGIINPNYPGFQHLAYTLSEFFIEQPPYDSCDSDLSDQDNDFTSELKYYDYTNSHKNYLGDADSNSDKFEKSEHNNTKALADINRNVQLSTNQKDDPSFTNSTEMSKQSSQIDFEPHQNNQLLNTPDILIKNCKNSEESMFSKKYRPDLLRGVSSLHLNSANESRDEKTTKATDVINTHYEKYILDRATSPSTNEVNSPVDIIGNFGQEIEREFGLIVSCYRQIKKNPINNDSLNQQKEEKITDAFLSATSDTIITKEYNAENDCKSNGFIDDKLTNLKVSDSDLFLTNTKTARLQKNCVKAHTPPTNSIYSKLPYDDRLLAPIPLDYKCCQSRKRIRPSTQSFFWNDFDKQNNLKQNASLRNQNKNRPKSCDERICLENELFQYHQLINDKDHIVRSSKYAKLSTWAQYLTRSDQQSAWTINLKSSSTLELFDAYKIEDKSEMDFDALQKHFRMASEIEKQKRSERDEIRRKLATNEEPRNCVESKTNTWRSTVGGDKCNSFSSDNESYSSDSETCPKLSIKQHRKTLNDLENPFDSANQLENIVLINQEDEECAFFTKQAKLQIETRMALSQAKQIAYLQMELNKHSDRNSPISAIVKSTLKTIGIKSNHRRRLSRQLLTSCNIAQLHILLNHLLIEIENFNDSLVKHLLKRDDLQMEQDSLMDDIEKLSKYLGTMERKNQGNGNNNNN